MEFLYNHGVGQLKNFKLDVHIDLYETKPPCYVC